MKLNKNFIRHTMDGQAIVVPTADADFHGLVQGNKAVDVILNCLLQDTTTEEIVAALKERFDGSEDDMRADVDDVLSQLREIGAIDD